MGTLRNEEKEAAKKESVLAPGVKVDHIRIIRPLGAGDLARDIKQNRERIIVESLMMEANVTGYFCFPNILAELFTINQRNSATTTSKG